MPYSASRCRMVSVYLVRPRRACLGRSIPHDGEFAAIAANGSYELASIGRQRQPEFLLASAIQPRRLCSGLSSAAS